MVNNEEFNWDNKINIVPAPNDTFCVCPGKEKNWIDRVFAFRVETIYSPARDSFFSYAYPISGGENITESHQITFCGSKQECEEYIKDQKEAKP